MAVELKADSHKEKSTPLSQPRSVEGGTFRNRRMAPTGRIRHTCTRVLSRRVARRKILPGSHVGPSPESFRRAWRLLPNRITAVAASA